MEDESKTLTTEEIAAARRFTAALKTKMARPVPTVDVATFGGSKIRIPATLHKTALREFKSWKHTLSEILRREARIAWATKEGAAAYSFVLPAKLVRLVWTTTINERIKLETVKQSEGAAERALRSIQAEVTDAVEQIVSCWEVAVAKQEETVPEGQDLPVEEGPMRELPDGVPLR